MPPTRFVPLKVTELRYGCGSFPASPYEKRNFPKVNPGGWYMLVNVQAALAFGNTAHLLLFPNVVEQSLRKAPVRKSWLIKSSCS